MIKLLEMTSYEEIINFKKTHEIKPHDILDDVFKKIENAIIEASKLQEQKPEKSWRAEKPSFLKKVSTNKDDILTADINVLLNKMSPKNFEDISKNIIDILNKNRENINFFEVTLESVFKKAVTQSIYCSIYTQFIKKLFENKFNVGDILLSKCNKFKYILKEEEGTESRSYNTEVTRENYAKFCKDLKDKSFKKGYSQFIGELYNKSLVSREILCENINICIENITNFGKDDPKGAIVEDNCICVVNTLNTITNAELKSEYKDSMNTIQKTPGLPKRIDVYVYGLKIIRLLTLIFYFLFNSNNSLKL